MRAIFYIALSSIILASTPAVAYCSKPSAPYCATSFGEFGDQWELDRCKSEMESYQDDVRRYMSCRNDEAQTAVDDAQSDNNRALNEFNDAISSFNSRAR